MRPLRNWLAALLLWFFFLYNIERISEPINLATFVYVFALVSALAVLLIKPLLRVKLYWLFVIALPPYLLMKWLFGYHLLGKHFPITVTEICAIGLTILISGQVIRQMYEMGDAVKRLTIDKLNKGTYPFEIGQDQIYREVRRARKRQQPLSLIAVTVSDSSLKENLNHFIKEFEKEIIRFYVNARVGNMLTEKLHSTDIITQRNNHFIILLPDTARSDAFTVVERIQGLAKKTLGLDLMVGVSSFPDEATTFETLMENAEEQMAVSSAMIDPISLPDEAQLPKEVMHVR